MNLTRGISSRIVKHMFQFLIIANAETLDLQMCLNISGGHKEVPQSRIALP